MIKELYYFGSPKFLVKPKLLSYIMNFTQFTKQLHAYLKVNNLIKLDDLITKTRSY